MLPPGVLAWETFWGNYPGPTQVPSEKRAKQTKVLLVWNSISPGCHQVYPLVHLHPASGVEPGGTSETPASIRDRLSPTRKGKLWWRVCLHPHLEQEETLLVERSHGCGYHFFPLSQMGANRSRTTLLQCILKNWDKFDTQSLKRCLIFCDTE